MSRRMQTYFRFKSTLILLIDPNSSMSVQFKQNSALRECNDARATFGLFVKQGYKQTANVATLIFRLVHMQRATEIKTKKIEEHRLFSVVSHLFPP